MVITNSNMAVEPAKVSKFSKMIITFFIKIKIIE